MHEAEVAAAAARLFPLSLYSLCKDSMKVCVPVAHRCRREFIFRRVRQRLHVLTSSQIYILYIHASLVRYVQENSAGLKYQ